MGSTWRCLAGAVMSLCLLAAMGCEEPTKVENPGTPPPDAPRSSLDAMKGTPAQPIGPGNKAPGAPK